MAFIISIYLDMIELSMLSGFVLLLAFAALTSTNVREEIKEQSKN